MLRFKLFGLMFAMACASLLSACGSGDDGANGLSTLMALTAEPAGANCSAGGTRVAAGLDRNADGALQPAEATQFAYVCDGPAGTDGTNGANGTNGTDGLTALIALTVEPVGANCASGGTRVDAGPDGNSNRVLDAGEIGATSYVCNGLAPAWVNVAAAVQQAEANRSYLANAGSLVTLTLPASAQVGDTVAVAGGGAGGWRIAQNAGDRIVTDGLPAAGHAGTTWTARESNRNWYAVASSADGARLVAAADAGQIYTSSDSGATWNARDSARAWSALASSSDGRRLLAAVNGGQLYTSDDGGVSWAARESARNWRAAAASADGVKLVAAVAGGQIYTSTDQGVTWSARESNRNWSSVASAADGMRLLAAVDGGQLYTSTDGGATWTPRESNRGWLSVASSSDGIKLIAAAAGGQIYTSVDGGATWVARESNRNWVAVASSADGSRLLAGVFNGLLYTSADSGATWAARESARLWSAMASSSQGTKLVATASGAQVYTSVGQAASSTSPGIAGSLSGSQYQSVTLLHLGGGVWSVVGFVGTEFGVQ